MCIEELEIELYEMDMLRLELASDEYKKGREKKESEEGYTDQLVILYSGTCTPSKKVKDANDKVKDPWKGKAIDCSATPQPAECQGATRYPTSYYYKKNADGTKVKVEIPLGGDKKFLESLPQS